MKLTAALPGMILISAILTFSAQAQNKSQADDPFHKAVQDCIKEKKLKTPTPGHPPSPEDRAKMSECLKGKGVTPPMGGHPGGPPPGGAMPPPPGANGAPPAH
jgi:hypothetical protein